MSDAGTQQFWVTTHNPHPSPNTIPWDIYLRPQHQQANREPRAGDRVFFYELLEGIPIPGGATENGKGGIVAVADVIGGLLATHMPHHPTVVAEWPLQAKCSGHDFDGFVMRRDRNNILGFQPGYTMRGFGGDSGLKRIDADEYVQLLALFKGKMRIVSGGQTGADRAALDAAMKVGVPCGGWCPAGRKAENGPIPDRYPVKELAGAGYPQRTRQNVIDSDGTLVVSFGPPEGGTALTVLCCQNEGKPHLIIDANMMTPSVAAKAVAGFVKEHKIQKLNVAGPRASKQPAIYAYVVQLVGEFLRLTDG